MGKRHLTPAEIKEQCKRIARESRMADRTPWTAMGIICSYVIMRREGFKGQRISRLANKVNEMEADWSAGKVDMKEISQRLMDKAGWSIEYKAYTEDDITARKGSYQYWLDQKQIAPQNTINEQAILQRCGEMRRCPCSRWHRLQTVTQRNTVRTSTSGKNLIRKRIGNAKSTWIM